jgi:hypothetical protein
MALLDGHALLHQVTGAPNCAAAAEPSPTTNAPRLGKANTMTSSLSDEGS